MNKKQLLHVLGVLLVIIMLAFVLTKSIYFDNASLSIESQPTGLRVIAQNPIEGQRLDLSSSIEISFDRDMDTAKTGDAFSLLYDGETIPGKLTWLNDRTLSFTPTSRLTPATIYTATISTQATANDGTTLKENIDIEFQTVEALTVAQVFPTPDTQEVDLNTSITVIFNHPVVPVSIEEEQSKLPQPLILTPTVAGRGEWVNSSVYVFRPEKDLISGSSYQIRIEAGLKDTLGNSLEESFNWQFNTRAPVIYHFALKDGEQNPSEEVKNVPLDQAFIVSFQQPMDQLSTEGAVSLINRETSNAFPVNFKWDKTFTTLTIEPKGKFKIASFYELTIADSAKAVDGGKLKEGLIVHFATVPLPSIVSVFPATDSKVDSFISSIRIVFASPMDFDSMKGRVLISPALAGIPDWSISNSNKTLLIRGLAPATDYVVRILPGMQDPYGNETRDEISYTFKNGDYSTYASLAQPWTPLVYRAKGTQEVYFEHRNMDEATISIYPLAFDQFQRFMNGTDDLTSFAPKVKAVREWNIVADKTRNVFQSELFKFADESGKPLEPGYYFIGVKGEPLDYSNNFYQGCLFIVATDNITLKATPTEGLAWLTDLESGAPQKDVSVIFYDDKFNEIGTRSTDQDGLAYLENIKAANYARAEGKDHLAFTSLYWGSGVSTGDFGIASQYYKDKSSLFGYLYTDRPVYRPDQEVFFKGLLRENDDLHYSLPEQKQVYVVVEQWGEKIFSEYVPVNEQGSFSGVVKLAQDVSLGSYKIYAYPSSSSESPICSVDFNIAEYKKPEFEVIIKSDKTDMLVGEKVNFGLDAAYYSGGNLKDAQADWFIESSLYYFTPNSQYNQYSFMDWDRDVYWSPNKETTSDTEDQGKGGLDENGHLDISQTFTSGKDKISQQMTLYANVADVAGNTVSGSVSVIVHQSRFYAGIHSERYIGKQGEEQPFSVVVLDWNSQPITGQKVTVSFVQRQWFSAQKKDEQGQLSWETSVKEIPISTQNAVTGTDGIVQVNFVPPAGGVYKAVVTVHDSKGNTHQASTYIWIASVGAIAWRQTNDRAFNLIADKDVYAPGDTAEILIAQPFEGKVYALVTYERGHIYKQEVVLLEGNSTVYQLPITNELAPMAYVSVTVISGAENTGTPDFKIGMAIINIDLKQKTIDVSVTTDKKSAGPGDDITYTISTKDIDGKPVIADVSLAVVDKAALALAPSNSAPMLESFYSRKALSVRTSLSLVSSADDFNAAYRPRIPSGKGEGGGGSGELGIITVRENFKDTAVFEAEIMTDEKGTAQVNVKLPENLTTWSADVRAITADSRVGEATSELLSTKPLFVQLQTPRFFVVDDQVMVGATIFNNTENSLQVKVSLNAQGLNLKSNAAQSIDIEGKGQAYVTWDVIVKKNIQRVDMTATAVSGQFTDASKPALGTLSDQGIPVLTFTAKETVGTSGMITSANSVTENFQLPTTLNFDDANLSIEVSPSLAVSLGSGLTYLEDYPYLCMEQTISRFLPNVITSRALKTAGMPSSKQASLDAQVNAALQRIYAKQLYDGGWNWWDGQQSDPQTSAYVVYGLLEAKDSSYVISETVLNNGINYLIENLPDLERNDPSWQFNRFAFMLYVLVRADALGPGLTNFIFEHRASLDLYGEAFLTQAIFLLDPEDSRISTLLSDLATATMQSAAGAHWEETTRDYWNWNSDTRTTAIVLNTFVQIDPTNPINANAVRWLMAHRSGGHWYSTQETTWSLIALTNWLIASKEFETNYRYAIGLNDKLLEQGQAYKDNLTDSIKLQVQLKDLLTEQTNSLVLTRGRGVGNLYYTAYLSASLPIDQIQPLDQGISLSREYFTLDDSKTPITEIKRGELVKVRLTVVVPAAVHYVVINDPLPAGMEALDSTLATDTAVPSSYTAQDYIERGWGWWYFSHVELHDEKVVLSTDYLPAGTYVYTYIARASTAGTFNVIPPTASEFYFPDVSGRGAGSVFEVK